MLDGDYTAKERCQFCEGVLAGICKRDGRYLVQCQDCGAITDTAFAQKNNNKPSRMAKVRKMAKKYYDSEVSE